MTEATPLQPVSILLVDDDPAVLAAFRRVLLSAQLQPVMLCERPEHALDQIRNANVGVVVLDLVMAPIGGEALLTEINEAFPDLPVVVVTAEYDAATAVRCMKLGALDYLLKPVSQQQLITSVERALEQFALRNEMANLGARFCESGPSKPEVFADIITRDPAMQRLFNYIEAVAPGSQPVLVTGESGTGKELIARALHTASGRPGEFVGVNTAGLDDTMFTDSLFGHEPGAFTGARGGRSGLIAQAAGGTLFLDEIGDLPDTVQVKLLRLLQEREYFPLGADVPVPLRARVVAATHRGRESLREDLFFRLRAHHVEVPPLRQREGDLPLLVEHFLAQASKDLGKSKPTVPPELYVDLADYPFPGNVRELHGLIFDVVARNDQPTLPIALVRSGLQLLERDGPGDSSAAADLLSFPQPMPTLREIESAAIAEALQRAGGNQSAAARMLAVSRPTIARYLARGTG